MFWSSVCSKYSQVNKPYHTATRQLAISKSILMGVKDLRGDSKYSEKYADLYRVLGMFLYKVHRKDGTQSLLFSAKLYLDLAKRVKSGEEKGINHREFSESILSCTLFDRLGSIMDLDSLFKVRVDDTWTCCSMDISRLMNGQENGVHFKKSVSFEVSKSNIDLGNESRVPQTPQMKTNSLPGFFPQTPQTPQTLSGSFEEKKVGDVRFIPAPVMNTPQLLKSVPGYFPKSVPKKGILKQTPSDLVSILVFLTLCFSLGKFQFRGSF
jgi:hypothetical protein